ncbi:hypothetical protein HNP55_000052 [Paucibacter oligotrophus]|uniref:MSHA biogenesis protein MshK n=1 Tax=Roseateles oligotrophus TaxID=1769250 RepID=A0A840L821_9BURK|nr:hypothetical protein [Roseateles oligotrophus]MBB4841557.1 hypothetical protein [Roseateles oligotrophus]
MRRPLLPTLPALLTLFLLGALPVHGEELRDPSSWPAALRGPAGSTGEGEASGNAAEQQIKQIVVRHGKPFVVAGGREWGVGAKLGTATILRIEEQAVWLRDAQGSRRVALYPGIEKKAASDAGGGKPRPTAAKAKKSKPEVSAPLQETP